MAVMKELLIGQDEQRSNNPQDCTAIEAPKATSVMDAIRMACANLGIDHDVAECIAAGTQARMRTALSIDGITGVVRSVYPDAKIHVTFDVHRSWLSGGLLHNPTLAQAQEVAAAIVAEHGGNVEVHYYDDCRSADGGVQVTLQDDDLTRVRACIYFGKGATTNV